MSALQHFFDAERLRRGWSMREIANRSRMSLSKAYAIVNGDDNVEFETFENIATAFAMTPADLAIAIGKGSPEHSPDEVEMLAIYRQVPTDQRPFVQAALRGLAVQPLNRGPDNRVRDRRANRSRPPVTEIDHNTAPRPEDDANPGITRALRESHIWRLVANLWLEPQLAITALRS